MAGENHIVKPSAFADFWARLLRAQGVSPETQEAPTETTVPVRAHPSSSPSAEPASVADEQGGAMSEDAAQHGRMRAVFTTKDGLHVQLEGGSAAMASFLQHWQH
jgi:hypothetical protein